MQLTVSVAVMQLEVPTTHMQVTVSAANMWVAICIVITLTKKLVRFYRELAVS